MGKYDHRMERMESTAESRAYSGDIPAISKTIAVQRQPQAALNLVLQGEFDVEQSQSKVPEPQGRDTEAGKRHRNARKIQDLDLQVIELADKLVSEQLDRAALQTRIAQLEEQIRKLKDDQDYLETNKQTLAADLEKLKGSQAAHEVQCQNFEERIVVLKGKLKRQEKAEMERQVLDDGKLEQALGDLAALKLKSDAQERELADSREEFVDHNRRRNELAEVISEYLRGALIRADSLQAELTQLKKSTKPLHRLVVICVDVSGSLVVVLPQVKQVYRDVVMYLVAKSSNAKVAVMNHGTSDHGIVYQPDTITEMTLGFLDSDFTHGMENYGYCLSKGREVLVSDVLQNRKAVVMIGDGNVLGSDGYELRVDSVAYLQNTGIPAHSVIVPSGFERPIPAKFTMEAISEETGGRVQTASTYFSALNELVGGH